VNSTVKTVLFWVGIGVSALVLWTVIQQGRNGQKDAEINFSQFMTDVDQGKVHEVTVDGMQLRGKFSDNSAFHTTVPANYPDMIKALQSKGVLMTFRDANSGSWPLQLLGTWAPLILLGALWFFMIRQMQTGGNKALSFGKSRARLLSMQQKKVTFKDVAGVEEAKEELREIIEFLREAQKFQKLGRSAGWTSGNRQDALSQSRSRRSQRSVLLNLRFGFCRDVCRRRRKPRARPVRTRQEERALHHFHRRN
jgi:cell division protease FtsH